MDANVDDASIVVAVSEPFETWRSIPGFEGSYEASSLGGIRSLPRKNARPGVLRTSLSVRVGLPVYRRVGLSHEARQYNKSVHRLVALAFHGLPRRDRNAVRYLNGDSLDNRAENLRWGSCSENAHDAIKHGVHPKASRTHCPSGHPYAGTNLGITPRGYRRCRTCAANRKLAAKTALAALREGLQ